MKNYNPAKFNKLTTKKQMQVLMKSISELTQLKDWKVAPDYTTQTIYLRYPKKDKPIALDFVRSIRAQLRLYDLLPKTITISKLAI